VVKQFFGIVYVWATDLATGQPVAGLDLTLYDDLRDESRGQATTDANGLARFDYDQPETYYRAVLVMAGSPGSPGFGLASSHWSSNISPWDFGLQQDTSRETRQFTYLYTDRPIYRPGDTVRFKGIVRDTDYGRYPLPTIQSVAMSMMYLNDYSDVRFSLTLALNENGEFEGEYVIPEDAALGTYSLMANMRGPTAERTFTVAEYRAPEFQVLVTPDEAELLRGQATNVTVEATYFFGGSASDLKVNWTVYAQDYHLPWDGPYYSFGDRADFFYRPLRSPFSFPGSFYGQHVLSGQGVTDAGGRLVINLPADLLDELEPGSRTVTVEASVQDITNFPIVGRAEVVYHAAETYVGVRTASAIRTVGSEAEVELITVDWQSEPVANSDVEVIFYRRIWRPVRDAEFGMQYTWWEAEDTEVARDSVTTDGEGRARSSFTPERGGSYLAVATVTDGGGRSQTSSTFLWVADANFIGWRSDPREKRLDLVTDKDEYFPGDVARIMVQSPFSGPTRAWLTIERGDLIEQRVITLQGTSDVLEIPLTAVHAPNVHVGVTVVKGIDDSNPVPDMRLGLVELVVSPLQLALNVSLTPRQALLTPGDTAVYDVEITDYQGSPVQSSVSLALVDLAVLSLKPDNAPPIMEAFYARQPVRSQTGSGLIQSGEGLEVEIPEMAPGLGGGGGDGTESASFALEEEDEDVRRDFPDTAHWEAFVSTDAQGRATVEIPLPDSLTTWRLSSKAVSLYEASGETLVGQNQVDIMVTLPLLIRPVTPRFFVVGDSLFLSAVVHNNTGEDQEVTVTLDAAGLTLSGEAQQVVQVADGQRAVVRWPAIVDDVPAVDLTFRAQAGQYRDATKPAMGVPPEMFLPAVRYAGEDFVGTAGVLDEAGRVVEAILLPPTVDERQGQVTVQLNASLAAALVEALEVTDYNLGQTFLCPGAVTDELMPNVATATAIKNLDLDWPQVSRLDAQINEGIRQLARLQMSGGGWGWCYSTRPDPWLTAYALLALTKADQAGYDVPAQVLTRAASAVSRYVVDPADLNQTERVNAQAFYLYVLAEAGAGDRNKLDALFEEQRELMDPYARALLILAYDITGGGAANQRSLLADLSGSAILSATGAHWENAVPDWANLSSDIRGTAMVLGALVKVEPDSFLAPNAVRWLMTAREASRWPTRHETAWSILALADWMVASRELEADFSYQFLVNGQGIAEGSFTEENVAESERLPVAVGDLILDDVNFLDFQRGAGEGRLYYTAHLNTFLRAEGVQAVDRGISVSRVYYDAACDPQETTCEPIDRASPDQQVRVELTIIARNDLVYAIVEDPIPSGTEAIDPALETTPGELAAGFQRVDADRLYGYWGWWYFNRVEFRDSRVVFFSEFLPAGTYQYTYYLQPVIAGEFQVIPATARQEYMPEVFGRSDGFLFTVEE
jgi:alpha-2-macroglobulin